MRAGEYIHRKRTKYALPMPYVPEILVRQNQHANAKFQAALDLQAIGPNVYLTGFYGVPRSKLRRDLDVPLNSVRDETHRVRPTYGIADTATRAPAQVDETPLQRNGGERHVRKKQNAWCGNAGDRVLEAMSNRTTSRLVNCGVCRIQRCECIDNLRASTNVS